MRELKFRAWSTNTNRTRGTMHYLISSHQLTDLIEEERWKVMQYTGLKDKNGKEIYEGDVVKYLYRDGLHEVYFGGGLQGEPADGTYPYEGWCFGHGEVTAFSPELTEVLGNIYENPGLVGGK